MLIFCWLLLACGSGGKAGLTPPASGNPDAGTGGIPPDDEIEVFDDLEDVKPHAECLDPNEKLDPTQLWAKALPPIAGDGKSEIPLSPKGCVRIVRTVEKGRVSRFSVRRWGGFATSNVATITDYTKIKFFEYEQVYLNLRVGTDGALDLTFNLDDDPLVDAHLTETYAGDLIARQEFTRFNSSNTMVERRTLTSVDADTIHYKVERLRNNALATIADFDAPSVQNQNVACYMPPPSTPSDTVPCTDEQKQMLRARMKTAIERGVACFDKLEDGASIEQYRLYLFYAMEADTLEIECFQSNKYWGQMTVGKKGPKLRINAQLLGCEQANQNFIDATLFHEVLHEIRGPHDANDNELDATRGPFGPRANAYTDSIRGCEELCFGTIKTACSCASCFQTDTCDSRCSNMPSCVSRDPMGVAQMSEAVGALCRDPANVPAEKKKSTWHATMMDCQSSCTFGANQCKSYSLSCDDSCQ